MPYEPLMDGKPATNLYEEHQFVIEVTFGASTALTYVGKDVTATRPTATTLSVFLPKSYERVVRFFQGWQKATGADPLQLDITTNNVATTGELIFTPKSTNSAGTATAPANGDKVWLTICASSHPLNAKFGG